MSRKYQIAAVLRICLWMLVLPPLKRVYSLQRLAALMWADPKQMTRDRIRERRLLELIGRAYARGRVRRRHNCLERSLVAYRLLSRLNADPSLVIGIAPGDQVPSRGHAWVVVDGDPVIDTADDLEGMTPMISFGRCGALVV